MACLFGAVMANGEDLSFWLTVDTDRHELESGWSTASHVQGRSPDMAYLDYVRASQRFFFSLDGHWTLGAHPAFEFRRSDTTSPWRTDYRVELEANGKWSLGEAGSFGMRSRWEVRWRQDTGGRAQHRFRQRFRVNWKLDESSWANSVGAANEVFFDEGSDRVVANRFFPLIVGLKASKRMRASAYLMYLLNRPRFGGEWAGAYVLGTNLKF